MGNFFTAVCRAIDDYDKDIEKVLISTDVMLNILSDQCYINPAFLSKSSPLYAMRVATTKGVITLEYVCTLEEPYQIIPKITAFSILKEDHVWPK